jgi:small-conductance mechanosensitive channel
MKELLEYQLLAVGNFSITVWSLLSVVLIYIIARIVIFLSVKFFRRFAKRRNMDKGRLFSFLLLLRYFIWTFTIMAMIHAMGINFTFLLASSAALLVGLGLGLRQIFADIVSGVFLLFEGTIEIGDILEVDGMVGKIEDIGLRTSIFRNRDDVILIIPNHKFMEENVVNWSHNNKATRFIITVSVSYESDMELVKKVLLDCVMQHKHTIIDDPNFSPSVRMANFLDHGVLFELLFYSENMFRIESTKSDIRFIVWHAFKQHGIIIPYPQLDVRMR